MNVIEISTLRKALDLILLEIEKECRSGRVELKEDFYVHVPKEKLFDVTNLKPECDVGSLVDDYSTIQNIACGKSDVMPILLESAAPILRYVALQVSGLLGPNG